MANAAVDLDSLSAAEQLDLLEAIWDRLSRSPSDVPVSDEQRQLLDERLDALEQDVASGGPLGEPWADVRRRFKQ